MLGNVYNKETQEFSFEKIGMSNSQDFPMTEVAAVQEVYRISNTTDTLHTIPVTLYRKLSSKEAGRFRLANLNFVEIIRTSIAIIAMTSKLCL